MGNFLRKRWFLCGLLILIPAGFALGSGLRADQVTAISARFAGTASRCVVAVVLFLMSLTLDSRKLLAALRAPGPVVWATAVNHGVMPLLAIPLMSLQQSDDFAVGLMIAASVPCTMAAASVWTRKAGGNDAVSLLVTVLTNGLCFAITPFWLRMGLGDVVALDIWEMMQRLFVTALLPIAAGQVSRCRMEVRGFADRAKTPLGVVAQCCILLLVFWASLQGGPRLRSGEMGGGPPAVAIVWFSCIGLHLFALGLSLIGSRAFGFSREDVAGTAFAGSQKTLPIGIYIATDLLAGRGVPFAVFPMLMFHASQLFLDTIIVEPLERWVRKDPQQTPALTSGDSVQNGLDDELAPDVEKQT